MAERYGMELILDLHRCDTAMFNREDIEDYFSRLCRLIDMQRCELYFWDDEGVPEEEKQTHPHTRGISAVQFILTSNITIHTLELLGSVYINIFSCKDFDTEKALDFSRKWFGASEVHSHVIERTSE